MEKLYEVNMQLEQILNRIETYMFVEKIDRDDNHKINNEMQDVIVEIKQ